MAKRHSCFNDTYGDNSHRWAFAFGDERLAQVYREIEAPKLQNLKRAAFVIFVFSFVFTTSVAFFAVMLIPDSVRSRYFDNLIAGISMFLAVLG